MEIKSRQCEYAVKILNIINNYQRLYFGDFFCIPFGNEKSRQNSPKILILGLLLYLMLDLSYFYFCSTRKNRVSKDGNDLEIKTRRKF